MLSPSLSAVNLEDKQRMANVYERLFMDDLTKRIKSIKLKMQDAKEHRDLYAV